MPLMVPCLHLGANDFPQIIIRTSFPALSFFSLLLSLVTLFDCSSRTGTKAFTDFWSKALDAEYANKGIRFMSITPGLVVSNMSKVRKASLMVSTPNYIARRTLARAGKDVELSPYYVHAIIVYEHVNGEACYLQQEGKFGERRREARGVRQK